MENYSDQENQNPTDEQGAWQMLNDVLEVINADQETERRNPCVIIEEQPALTNRFRYESEGRSAGALSGVNSTRNNKTYPTLKIEHFFGRAFVVVSCVTKDAPYRPHPHNLVGREDCKKGVCSLKITSEDMRIAFRNLGIQCVTKNDIKKSLIAREKNRIDPFQTGFAHGNLLSSNDLKAVRLCFQVFLKDPSTGRYSIILEPVVSDPIVDKKSASDLVITKLSHCNAICNGGQEMILLCERISKEDIQVRFYDDTDGWEGYGEFQHSQVHKQVAIPFRTPRYKSTDITDPVKVKIQLKRPSDGLYSEPLDFEMLPNQDHNRMIYLQHKAKNDNDLNNFRSTSYFSQEPSTSQHHFSSSVGNQNFQYASAVDGRSFFGTSKIWGADAKGQTFSIDQNRLTTIGESAMSISDEIVDKLSDELKKHL